MVGICGGVTLLLAFREGVGIRRSGLTRGGGGLVWQGGLWSVNIGGG